MEKGGCMRLFALSALLIVSTGAGAQGTPGEPTCAELMAYGADRSPDYREEAKSSFFGKPLAEYSPNDIVAIRSRTSQCDPRTPLYSEGYGFVMQKLDEVRRVRLRLDTDKQRAGEQKRADVAKSEQDKQKELERQQLKSGEKMVSTIEDASLMYDAKGAFDIMKAPLLRPDGAVYSSRIELYRQDGADSINGRFQFPPAAIANFEFIARTAGMVARNKGDAESQKLYQDTLDDLRSAKRTYYVYLKTTKQTKYLGIAPERLRLGEELGFVGKYIANRQYTDSNNEVRTAPVLEVLYFGVLPQKTKTR